VRLRRGPAHAPPLAAVDDEEDEDAEEDLAPSLEPPSPLEPDGVDFLSAEPEDSEPEGSEPEDSEPDEDAEDAEDAEDLAAFRLSVL
jgi:hypothetical protein